MREVIFEVARAVSVIMALIAILLSGLSLVFAARSRRFARLASEAAGRAIVAAEKAREAGYREGLDDGYQTDREREYDDRG